MIFEANISSIRLKDGATIAVPPKGVAVIVGPNNVGKTLTVNESYQLVVHPAGNFAAVMVDRLDWRKSGSPTDVLSWLRESGMTHGEGGSEIARRYTVDVSVPTVPGLWEGGPPFGNLGYMFIQASAACDAASWVHATDSYDAAESLPVRPLQYLYTRPDLERELSDMCREAFGFGLVLDRYAGNKLYLRVGDSPHEALPNGIPTRTYLDALRTLPPIEREGSGVQNFVGLLLLLTASPPLLAFLDEPDAFLHPPQAELMGKKLAAQMAESGQAVIATHNSHLLRGLLSDPTAAVTVVRLTRRDGRTSAMQLEPRLVRELWEDPLLRYSYLVDGLFHTGVVVCEADADCRFYQSVLDDLSGVNERGRELLFAHCGGKERMPKVVRTLQALAVPAGVIADFDILRDEQKLRELISALGGNWASVNRDWGVVKAALDGLPAGRLSRGAVRGEIGRYLNGVTTPFLEPNDVQQLRSLTRSESGWDRAKQSGLAALPPGQAYEAAQRLIETLRRIGVFVVQVGELEGFVRQVGNHGTAWLAEVYEQGLYRSATEAQQLLRHVEAYFRPYQTGPSEVQESRV